MKNPKPAPITKLREFFSGINASYIYIPFNKPGGVYRGCS